MERKPICYMMIGLPGAGKSTYVERHFPNLPVVCPDRIREVTFGDVNDQSHNNEVFAIAHCAIVDHIRAGRDCVFDATNINAKRRRSFNQMVNGKGGVVIGIVVATPYILCFDRNNLRERVVPTGVIARMAKSFQTPMIEEGFEDLYVVGNIEEGNKACIKDVASMKGYDQHNSHHTLTLDAHCKATRELITETTENLYFAALYHDIGKIYTQTFDENGEAHYYGHANLGAYLLLTYGFNLYTSALVCHHMDLYNPQFKFPSWWSKDFIEELKTLHEADKLAH